MSGSGRNPADPAPWHDDHDADSAEPPRDGSSSRSAHPAAAWVGTTAGLEPDETEVGRIVDRDTWLRVAVKLVGCQQDERADVLAEHELPADQWDRSDAHWSLVLATEVAAGNWAYAERYACRCAQRMSARGSALERAAHEHRAEAEPCGIDETAFASNMSPAPALPFQPNAASGPMVPSALGTARRLDLMGETKEMGMLPADAALPFAPSAAAAVVLERYAELCAQQGGPGEPPPRTALSASPAASAEIDGIHRSWQERFACDPRLRERWERLVLHARQRLARRSS